MDQSLPGILITDATTSVFTSHHPIFSYKWKWKSIDGCHWYISEKVNRQRNKTSMYVYVGMHHGPV